jgi:hypothetical protein
MVASFAGSFRLRHRALYANARLRNEGYDLEERLLSAAGAA